MTRRADGGHYAAAVSIRSGRGAMTHDRVMRFVPIFESQDEAARFAAAQALAWLEGLEPARVSSTIPRE